MEERVQAKLEERLQEEREKVSVLTAEKTRSLERIFLIKKKCAKDKPLLVIADELEAEPDELSAIYNAVIRNPEKTEAEIYELL